jgi:hypothetical protein
MKSLKIIFALALLNQFTSTFVMAQAYHPLLGNKYKWEQFQGDVSSICNYFSGVTLFETNDTVIGIKTYRNIYATNIISLSASGFYCPPYLNSDSNKVLFNILREDTISREVYIYDFNNSNTEFLLYDFNALDGDTLQNYFISFSSPTIIDSVRVINYPSIGDRKTFFMNIPGSSGTYFYIEGLGGIYGLGVPGFAASGFLNDLTCVRDSNNNSIWGNCMSSFVGLDNHDSYAPINFNYLNSTKDFYVSGEIKSDVAVELIDVSGKLIYSNPKVKPHEAKSISFIKPGIYLYAIHYNGKTNSGRFIVY